jgi:hypothetical protein
LRDGVCRKRPEVWENHTWMLHHNNAAAHASVLIQGPHFQTIEEIQGNAIRELCTITESAFQEAFQQWKKCWERCITRRGDYFEGDGAYNAVK